LIVWMYYPDSRNPYRPANGTKEYANVENIDITEHEVIIKIKDERYPHVIPLKDVIDIVILER